MDASPTPTNIEYIVYIKLSPSINGMDCLNPFVAPLTAHSIFPGPALNTRGKRTVNQSINS